MLKESDINFNFSNCNGDFRYHITLNNPEINFMLGTVEIPYEFETEVIRLNNNKVK